MQSLILGGFQNNFFSKHTYSQWLLIYNKRTNSGTTYRQDINVNNAKFVVNRMHKNKQALSMEHSIRIFTYNVDVRVQKQLRSNSNSSLWIFSQIAHIKILVLAGTHTISWCALKHLTIKKSQNLGRELPENRLLPLRPATARYYRYTMAMWWLCQQCLYDSYPS